MSQTPSEMSTDQRAPKRMVQVSVEPVELYKVLKFEGMAESGGQAKAFIASGLVLVNAVVELQKRKKIVAGDVIEFNGERIEICLEPKTTGQGS